MSRWRFVAWVRQPSLCDDPSNNSWHVGCRWAGGVKDAPSLWRLLKEKRDGWQEWNEPHFPAKGFYHANQDRPGSVRTRGGFLVQEDARLFDHTFFSMTGREVETMDPSQRKLLEVGKLESLQRRTPQSK